jgi:glycosyltransferase involved in cell wall biosynthesis
MRIAIVHDWIIDIGGAERCLEAIYSLYPEADIYTLVFKEESVVSLGIDKSRIKNSFIQRFPKAKEKYRNYLPFFPLAIEQFDLSEYDVVLSSSHAVAKGVLTGPDQLHISYIHSPIRYAWDLQHQYLQESGLDKGIKGWAAKWLLHKVRLWDARTANGVDWFVANSHFIARRIWKAYRRETRVIYPPVDIKNFSLSLKKEDFYLTASRMVPYKKIDLIVEAFSQMPDKKLVVIGNGPDYKKVKSKAGRNVELIGYQLSDALKNYMQRAKAFIFAAEEDFGITPVEAQACGTPVIAYGKGGVTETVVSFGSQKSEVGTRRCLANSEGSDYEKNLSPTGIFFYEQTPMALIDAVNRFIAIEDKFNPHEIRRNAERFSKERFKKEFKGFVDDKVKGFYK